MADLRIHSLADSQATYSPDITVAVDDPGFSNTKKMRSHGCLACELKRFS